MAHHTYPVCISVHRFIPGWFLQKHDIVHITTSLQQVIPDGFPQPVYRFEDNPLTEERISIGKKIIL
jgi:hypothetical protein